MAQTKLQALNVSVSPRVVFFSLVPGEFSTQVSKSLIGKIRGRTDKLGRQFKLLEPGPGKAGDVTLLPWEVTPTDVVVLFSDEYVEACVGMDPTGGNTSKPELNFILKQAAASGAYNVWFGVVQNTQWDDVTIEGKSLKEFAHLLHELVDDYRIRKSSAQPEVLDDHTAAAASRLKSHEPGHCRRCGGAAEAPSETASSAAKPARGGLLSRWFSSGGS